MSFPVRADKRLVIDPRVAIAYRDIPAASVTAPPDQPGARPPVLFIHAWPLSGATWRRLVAELGGWRCLVPDSPGLGDSLVPRGTPLDARAQASYFRAFVDRLGLERFHLVAHDTGAMTARLLAAELGPRVPALALFDTEIPGHRPKGFGWATGLARLPGVAALYRRLLGWPRFLWSDVGLGAGYRDNDRYRAELMELFVRPLLDDDARFAGAMAYGRQVSWSLVDELAQVHTHIEARVKLIWGEDDPLFPLAGARAMAPQFKRCDGVAVLSRGRLCAYDEQAPAAAEHVRALFEAAEV